MLYSLGSWWHPRRQSLAAQPAACQLPTSVDAASIGAAVRGSWRGTKWMAAQRCRRRLRRRGLAQLSCPSSLCNPAATLLLHRMEPAGSKVSDTADLSEACQLLARGPLTVCVKLSVLCCRTGRSPSLQLKGAWPQTRSACIGARPSASPAAVYSGSWLEQVNTSRRLSSVPPQRTKKRNPHSIRQRPDQPEPARPAPTAALLQSRTQ